MEIEYREILDRLTKKIAQLTLDNEILALQVEKYVEQETDMVEEAIPVSENGASVQREREAAN